MEVGRPAITRAGEKARSLHPPLAVACLGERASAFFIRATTRTHPKRVSISEVNVLKLVGMKSCRPGFRRAPVLGLCVAVGMMLASCAKKPAGKRYELEGRVIAVDSGSKTLTVAHEDIPGLMPGMTMPFLVGAVKNGSSARSARETAFTRCS